MKKAILSILLGRTFTDNTDNVAFDGEDTWQDVQRYGSSEWPSRYWREFLIDCENAYIGSEERDGLSEGSGSWITRAIESNYPRLIN